MVGRLIFLRTHFYVEATSQQLSAPQSAFESVGNGR